MRLTGASKAVARGWMIRTSADLSTRAQEKVEGYTHSGGIQPPAGGGYSYLDVMGGWMGGLPRGGALSSDWLPPCDITEDDRSLCRELHAAATSCAAELGRTASRLDVTVVVDRGEAEAREGVERVRRTLSPARGVRFDERAEEPLRDRVWAQARRDVQDVGRRRRLREQPAHPVGGDLRLPAGVRERVAQCTAEPHRAALAIERLVAGGEAPLAEEDVDTIATAVTCKSIDERDGKGFYVFESVSQNQRDETVCVGTWTNIVRGV